MARVVLAVVGAGGWGRNHVRNFASMPEVELRYVCDRSQAVRDRIGHAHPEVGVRQNLAEVLEDPELAAVVVATDAEAHDEVARLALQQNKDVFVEKPLTLSARSSSELCELADARKRILMVGHLLLYHPAVEALRSLIDRGELGDVFYTYAQRLNLGVVRQRENAWWSLAPHDISVANYLLDAEPVAVSASGGVFLQTERRIEDVVFATLHYPKGRLAHVHVSWLDPHKTRRLTIVGSRKMAVFDDTSADQKLRLYDKGVEAPPDAVSYEQGVRVRTGDILVPALKMAEPLRRECQAFIHAVRTRERPRSNGTSGLAAVRVLEAVSRSLAEAGRRVSVSPQFGLSSPPSDRGAA